MVITVWDMDILSEADSVNDESAREWRASPEPSGQSKCMAITAITDAAFQNAPPGIQFV